MKDIEPVEAEVTNPQLGSEVDLAVGIQNGLARGASAHHRVILDRRKICNNMKRQ